jgi:hypothetical protein
LDRLIARDPILYNKILFRAFLHYSKKEVDRMTIQEYIDGVVMLKDVLEKIHAPFMNGG